MVRQFCHRYGVPAAFTDVESLLREAAPTVVHVTTPPHTHYCSCGHVGVETLLELSRSFLPLP